MGVRRDLSLVGCLPTSLCENLIPSSHQQNPKTTQTQNRPPWVPIWNTCSPDPRLLFLLQPLNAEGAGWLPKRV